MAAKPSDLDLLMIGKIGNGKSALGNAILGKTLFTSSDVEKSVIKLLQCEENVVKGRRIKIVDAPGVCETSMKAEDATNMLVQAMAYAISINPGGYDAFLIVMKFGDRFTAEDQITIRFLKKIFGEEFIHDFCILVITHGDLFQLESKKKKITFEEWCKDQSGDFGQLIKECNERVVLFDNITDNKERQENQMRKLFEFVDEIKSKGSRYTNKNFELASSVRENFIKETQSSSSIYEQKMRETSFILEQLQIMQLKGLQNKSEDLPQLLKRSEQLSDNNARVDKTVAVKSKTNSTGTPKISSTHKEAPKRPEMNRSKQQPPKSIVSDVNKNRLQMRTAEADNDFQVQELLMQFLQIKESFEKVSTSLVDVIKKINPK